MTKKNKILSFILGICVFVPAVFMLSACGHTHKALTEWSTDETYHWHACEDKKCTEVLDKAEHTYGDWTVRTPAGCETDGLEFRACVCGKEETRTILATGHTSSTEYTYDETNHWYDCSVCGYDLQVTKHTFDQTIESDTYLATAQTETNKATYYKSCVCGAKGTETFETDKFVSTITNISANKTYDGTAVVPTYTTHSDGAVTIEYKVKDAEDSTYTKTAPKDAGSYIVRISIAETEDYTAVSETQEFTISPIELTNIKVSDTYNSKSGNVRTVQMDHARSSSIISGDSFYIYVVFDSKNAGASVVSIDCYADQDRTTPYNNYSLSIDELDFQIHKLTPALGFSDRSSTENAYSADKKYDGTSVDIKYYVYSDEQSKSSVTQTWYESDELETKGNKLDSSPIEVGTYLVEIFLPESTNYKSATKTKLVKITPKLLELSLTKEYDGLNTYDYVLTTQDGLVDDDECVISLTTTSKNVGTYENEDAPTYKVSNSNYDIKTTGGIYLSLEITTKKLSGLELTTNSKETSQTITLDTENGIVDGESVKVNITVNYEQDYDYSLTLTTNEPSQGYAKIEFVEEGDYANYDFDTTDIGTITYNAQ